MVGCPDCAQMTSGDCGKHRPLLQPLLGWICPRCHTVYSPWVSTCSCHLPKAPIYYGGNT